MVRNFCAVFRILSLCLINTEHGWTNVKQWARMWSGFLWSGGARRLVQSSLVYFWILCKYLYIVDPSMDFVVVTAAFVLYALCRKWERFISSQKFSMFCWRITVSQDVKRNKLWLLCFTQAKKLFFLWIDSFCVAFIF